MSRDTREDPGRLARLVNQTVGQLQGKQMKQPKADLEDALFTLIDTLNKPNAAEADFQKVFEEHPDILYSLGYSEFLKVPRMYNPRTGDNYYPDFIARRAHDQRVEIVDLKLPKLKLNVLTKRGRRKHLSAEMQQYISQVNEYAQYFDDSTNQDWFQGFHNWDINVTPTRKIIGGGFDVNRDEVNRLLDDRNVMLSTYVDVLNVLMSEHARRYNSLHETSAWQMMMTIRVHEQVGRGDALGRFYIADRGHKFTRNRCALWVDQNGILGFSAFNNKRKRVELRSAEAISTDQFVLISVDFQASISGCVAVLLVNGRTVDYHFSSEPFEMEQKLLTRKAFIGGNLRADSGAFFDMTTYAEFNRILSIQERVKAYANVWSSEIGSKAELGTRFFPDSVMNRVVDGMQIVPGKRQPLYLGEGSQNPLSEFFCYGK